MTTLNISKTLSAIVLSAFLFGSCGNADSSDTDEQQVATQEEKEDSEGYEDGTWCADVEYYNPETGTRSNYELDVEVEDNELIQINWPSGGWLDGTHFSPEDISNGECSFTSDRGYRYSVTLLSEGGCAGNGAHRLKNDIERDQQALTCPVCAGEKYHYDDLCYSCERKKEEMEELAETCSRCSGYKMEWEQICSSCRDGKDEESETDNQ